MPLSMALPQSLLLLLTLRFVQTAMDGASEALGDGARIDFDEGYDNRLDCSWTVDCGDSGGGPVQLTFHSFETEAVNDYVAVAVEMDGRTSAVWSGGGGDGQRIHTETTTATSASASDVRRGLPAPFLTNRTATRLTVQFHSDERLPSQGFSASIQCAAASSGGGGGDG